MTLKSHSTCEISPCGTCLPETLHRELSLLHYDSGREMTLLWAKVSSLWDGQYTDTAAINSC